MFNTVREHLLKQNARSEDDAGCAYRGADGCKCAVGVLISDEFYDKDLEGSNIQDIDVLLALNYSIGRDISYSEKEMLFALQRMHDTRTVDDWPTIMDEIEAEFFYNKYLQSI